MVTMSILYAIHCFFNHPRMCNISHNLIEQIIFSLQFVVLKYLHVQLMKVYKTGACLKRYEMLVNSHKRKCMVMVDNW